MAIDYNQRYPDQTDTDSNYPQGKARNKTTPESIDGFPFEEDYINDQFGFFQAILKEANVTPSGSADNANNSDYLTALKKLFPTSAEDIITEQGDSVQDFINKNNPIAFGAVDGGTVDSSDALFNYWEYCLNNNQPFDISGGYTFLIKNRNYTDGSIKSYFKAESKTNMEVVFGSSKLIINPDSGQGQANLFDLKGVTGFSFDKINLEVDTSSATQGDNVRSMIIRDNGVIGSSRVKGSYINGQNCEGVFITSPQANYTSDGFSSPLRSRDINIEEINIDNSQMPFTFSNEYTGYGLVCQFSGDNTTVGKLVVDNIHRGVFLYGVKGVHILGGSITESNATTLNLGSYGTIEDINIKLNIIQNTNLATQLVRVQPHEIGTSGGGSVDIQAGREHNLSNITLDLVQEGGATAIERGVDINKTSGDNTSDSVFNFSNIDVKLISRFSNISRALTVLSDAHTQNSSNMYADNIVVRDSHCLSNSRVGLLENMRGNIKIKDSYFARSVQCFYGSSSSDTPNTKNDILLENTFVGLSLVSNGHYDVPIRIRNCTIGNTVSVDNILPAQNKTVIDSLLGGVMIGYKPRWGVYTNINDSLAMYSPVSPVRNLIAGGASFGSDNTPKQVALSTTSDLGTGTSSDIFHEQFLGNSVYKASVTNRVDIYMQKASSSSYSLATGILIASGLGTSKDFTAGEFKLLITDIFNSSGNEDFVVGDFSVSATDANTLTFSCAAGAEDMVVSIYEN